MRMIRVDLRSPPGFGDDELVDGIRKAVVAAGLLQPEVHRDEARAEIVVSFDVEATGLDTAPTEAQKRLRNVLSEAGLIMPVEVVGSTDPSS